MVLLDLTGAARRHPVELGVLPELDPRERELAINTWRGRMVNEHISSQVFAGLLPQAMRAGMSPAVQESIADMAVDELRHARMCAGVVAAFGEAPIAELPEIRPLPAHADADPTVAFLRNLVSVSCLSETAAVALIEGERRDLDTAPAGQVLRAILGDEVSHARLGWTVLAEVAGGLSTHQRIKLDVYIPVAIRHLIDFELDHLSPAPPPSPAAAAVGVCDGRNARQILFETIERVIVPGLQRHGFLADA